MIASTPSSRRRLACAVICGVMLLVSCGGSGVDSGGTGTAVALAAGPVSGLGSVVVNGVRFDDASAVIVDQDDAALSVDQVQVGMQTRIDATAVDTATTEPSATALAIRVSNELIGPVQSIGPLGASLTVLGQSVRITVATWFDAALAGGVSALNVGQVIQVYGQYNARTNEYVATRITPPPTTPVYQIRGVLASVDTTAQTLVVGGLTINYGALPPSSLPALTPGRFVRVTLNPTPLANLWTATKVAPGSSAFPDRNDVRIVGRISAEDSTAQFNVNGISVDATNATFPNGQLGVVLGARVAVVGSTASGVLTARTVNVLGDETLANSTFEFHGAITALNPTAQTLTVRGITVNFSSSIPVVGGALSDLAVGRTVVVVGTLDSNRTSIDAQTITFY